MKPHHYMAILVRIASVILAAYAIKQLILFVSALVSGLSMPVLVSFAAVVVPAIAAVLLWMFPITLAKAIASPELDNHIEPLKAQAVLMILVFVIGVYFAFYALVDAIYWVSLSFISSANDSVLSPDSTDDGKANMIATAFELAFAFTLIGKARTVSGLLLRFAK